MEGQTRLSGTAPGKCLMVVHSQTSDVGRIGTSLSRRGYTLERCCPMDGERLPGRLDEYAAVVVFGGPMSANDDGVHEGILAELRWLPSVLKAGTPYLGVCLGAQLMARALGATVSPHPDGHVEVGYYPVIPKDDVPEPHFDSELYVYHWHKEGFDLPDGAHLLASGATFLHQAYQYGRATYGIQFHPEVTLPILRSWCGGDSPSSRAPGAQCAAQQVAGHAKHDHRLGRWLEVFIDRWIGEHTQTEEERTVA